MRFLFINAIERIKKMHIHYIIPFRKNSSQYIKKIRFEELFKYRKRMIRASKVRNNSDNIYYFYYYFYDPLLRGEEESSLLRRVEEKEITMEKYEQMNRISGIIGIITDLDLPEKDLFDAYKGREEIEHAFDTMKNYLYSDKTYL
ncbi:MAG: transposase [Saccharolobus sp.]